MMHGHRSFCQRIELIPLYKLFKFCLWEERLLTHSLGAYIYRGQEELETALNPYHHPTPLGHFSKSSAIPQAENNPLIHIEIKTQRKLRQFIHWELFPWWERETPGVSCIWTSSLSWWWFIFLCMILNLQLTMAGHCCQGTKGSQHSHYTTASCSHAPHL